MARTFKEILDNPFAEIVEDERDQKIAGLAAKGWKAYEIAEELGMNQNYVGRRLNIIKVNTGMGKAELTKRMVAMLEEAIKRGK
jgi:DNA-binding NarL/FixJ family response regulator